MKFKNKKFNLLTLFLVASQSILFTLVAAFFIGKQFTHAVSDYPDVKSDTVILSELKNDRKTAVLNFFVQEAASKKLVITRADPVLSKGGEPLGTQVGILGDVDRHPLPLTFAGQRIFTNATLKKLLQSPASRTIGNHLGYTSIAAIPNFAGSQKLTIFQLPELINLSSTINGTYKVIGLNPRTRTAFYHRLAALTQKSPKQLHVPGSGPYTYSPLSTIFLLAGIGINALALLILFLLKLLQSLALLGDLVLLGWSKTRFLAMLYLPYIIAALTMTLVTVPLGITLSGRFFSFWSIFVTVSLLNTVLVAGLVLIASALLATLSFLDILKHKFPRKALLFFAAIGYILLSAGIVFGAYSLDGPLKTLNDTYQMSHSWHDIAHLTILKESQFGKQTNPRDAVQTRAQDFYRWYKDIYQKKGVYLIDHTIYTRQVIDGLVGAGVNMPTRKPFLQLRVSPNYLRELGVTLPADALTAAEQGKRLYLLPSSMPPAQRSKFEYWLRRTDTREISPTDTPTVFNKKRQFLFQSYHANNEFFTWATETTEPLQMKRAIILVATPANMTFFETDNLSAQGLNGSAKIDTSKMSRKTKEQIFTNSWITPYKPVFVSIGEYIKGVQKDLTYTLYLFGGIGALLLFLSMALAYAIIRIYQVSQQEFFNVKKFLGYSIFNIYRKPLLFLTFSFILELLATILLRSRAGTLVVSFKFILQLLFVLLYLRKSSIKQLLVSLKGDQ